MADKATTKNRHAHKHTNRQILLQTDRLLGSKRHPYR